MDQKTKFAQVIEILRTKGWDDSKITQLTTEITKASFNKLYTEAVSNFTDEDLDAIENCASDEEANNKIKELYRLRTGQDADTELRKFFDIFADAFLAENSKNPDS